MSETRLFDRGNILRIIAGTVLGGLAIYFAFQGVSLAELSELLSHAKPWPIILATIIVLLNVALTTLRWWVILLLKWNWKDYGSLLGGVFLGQMANILLPLRLGEVVRILYVDERIETSKSELLGSLVLEKALEIVAFSLALFFLFTAVSLPDWVEDPGNLFLILGLISLVAIIVLVLFGRHLLNWIKPLLSHLPGRWGERIAGIIDRVLRGFESMRSWRHQAIIWFFTFLSLLLSVWTNIVLFDAVDLKATFSAALFLLIVLRVGSAPPSAPGKLGVFHYLTVLALTAYSVEKDIALAFSLLLYIVALLPKILIGSGILLFSKIRLPTLLSTKESIMPEE
jgi:uncharacterized protein (TIRG00374 family)